MIASRMASGMSGIAAPRRTFSPWVVSPLLSVIVCTVSSVCLWCATRLDSHAHLCSIFQTYVGPTRSLPGGVCVCVCVCLVFVRTVHECVRVCAFGMTWRPPALFKHDVGCAGSLIVRLGLPLVHAVPGTPRRGKEGTQRGQAAWNTSPMVPKAPLVGLRTAEQVQWEMIMRTETVEHEIAPRDDITGF